MNDEILKNDPAQLMQRSAAGDSEAFGLLYELYFSPVYRYIYYRLQNKAAAEDITQFVFIQALKKIGKYRDLKRPPLAYFFTIARNRIIDHWRQNKRTESLADENDLSKIIDTADSVEEMVSRRFDMEEINRALENIPPVQREVIILKYLNELTYPEIAGILKKKEESIRQIASRGLRNLKKYLKS